MKLALVGATGLVGQKMMQILEERNVKIEQFIPVASSKSIGQKVSFLGKEHEVMGVETAISMAPDVALFSAGGNTSKQWAPEFNKKGTTVIDNSSAWRMVDSVPLCVPEINAHYLSHDTKIIANPNCSTIQMVVALAPLHRRYEIKRLIISTYQSITGTGKMAVDQMHAERAGDPVDKVYPHQIDLNCLPHCDAFEDNGYTKEEMKLVNETRKILGSPNIQITATAVRVPVMGGHSESINVEFGEAPDIKEIREILKQTEGVKVVDDPVNNLYPMPLTAHENDSVFVGRIRKDESHPNAINLWVVSDNLRKGAATNAIQILEHLVRKGLV